MKKILLVLTLVLFFVTPLFAQITEQVVIDKIEVLEDGQIQVRQATRIIKDGVEITKTYHRHVIQPDEDITKEDAKVKLVANAVWTKEIKEKFIKDKAERQKKILK